MSGPSLHRRMRAGTLLAVARTLRLAPTAVTTPLARAAARLARGSRPARLARQQVELAAGWADWDGHDVERVLRGVERHAADQLVQVLRLARGDGSWIDEEVEVLEGAEHLVRLEAGEPAVLATMHLGHWEVLAAWLRRRGIDGAVVGRGGAAGDWLASVRARHGVTTIAQDASARAPLEVLRAGGTLGVLCDLETRQLDGMHVPFLGRPALTMTAPAALARAAGCPLVPGVCVRTGPGRFGLRLHPPLQPPRRGSEGTLEVLTQLNEVFGSWILEHPDQWAWHQHRWRTAPREGPTRADPERRRRKRARGA